VEPLAQSALLALNLGKKAFKFTKINLGQVRPQFTNLRSGCIRLNLGLATLAPGLKNL
jgi:hypothetical protein